MGLQYHVIELLPAYVLGILEAQDELLVRDHLRVCKWCAAEFHQYRQVVEQLALCAPDAQPPSG